MSATHVERLPAHPGRTAPEQASATAHAQQPSRKRLWTGRVLSGFAVLFLTFDATLKLLMLPEAVEGTMRLGYTVDVVRGLGILQLACLVLYLVPRTSVLGVVLWTGYLGGAVATHVRAGDPLFSHVLFPVYVALFLWGGLWLRNQKLRALLPLT